MPSAAWRDSRPCKRERPALCNQLIECGLAIDPLGGIGIEVNRPKIARRAHWCADHGVGVLLPPSEDLCLIPGRVLEPVGSERLLVDWIARKNRNAAARIVERGLEHSGGVGLRLGHYVILPPRY